MGIPFALVIAAGGIGAITSIGKASTERRALEEEETQAEVATTQKRIKQDDQIERVLSSQKAIEAASPFKTTSASFGAIGKESINQFAQDREATNINLQFQKENINQQVKNVNFGEFMGVASNLVDAGLMYYRLKTPTSTATTKKQNVDPTRFEDLEL